VKKLDSQWRPCSCGSPFIVIMVAVAACALAVFAGGCSAGSSGAPDLTGLTSDEATQRAADAGLDLVQKDEAASFLPVGTVLAQEPLPGADSTDGTIQVTVSREPIKVQITKVRSADPDGDGKENDGQLSNLIDGDLSTSWSTEQTYKSPDFQGLGEKKGVGLSFWLADGATMLKISYTLAGWKGEVENIMSDNLPVAIASLGDSQQATWTDPIKSGRIWFYQLAPLPMGADNIQRYGAIINEIAFCK
jgi:hypothetical protein